MILGRVGAVPTLGHIACLGSIMPAAWVLLAFLLPSHPPPHPPPPFLPRPLFPPTFPPPARPQVNRAMTRRYFKDMDEFAESDVVIVGAGSAGLACAFELGRIAPHLKVSQCAG